MRKDYALTMSLVSFFVALVVSNKYLGSISPIYDDEIGVLFGVSVACAGFLVSIPWLVWAIRKKHSLSVESDFENQISRIVFRLRKRADSLRDACLFTLLMIFLSLVVGLFIFGKAEHLSFKQFKNDLLQKQYELTVSNDELEKLKTEAEFAPSGVARSVIMDKIDSKKAYIRQTEQYIDSLKANQQQESDVVYITSILTTKIGSILLLIFLVQILISLYRYASRMAAFCDSRADILELCADFPEEKIEVWASLLRADVVDFGRMPSSPSGNLISSVAEVLKQKAAEKK